MTKSELIELLTQKQSQLGERDVELAVNAILERMSDALASGERIEIRGFGSFSLHFRPPRIARNPRTGDAVATPGKHVPYFKPGKELKERVNVVGRYMGSEALRHDKNSRVTEQQRTAAPDPKAILGRRVT